MKKSICQFVTIVIAAVFFTSCNSTKIVEAYKTEDVKSEFKKVYVVGLTGEQIPEEKIASEIVRRFEERGVKANSTHVSFKDCKCESAEEIAELTSSLVESNYDAILTFARVNTEKEMDYTNLGSYDTPSGPTDYPYYSNYYSYYGFYKPLVYSKGYVESNRVYNLEATLFDLNKEDLVWIGRTKTTEPLSNEKFAEGYAKSVVDKLIYEDLVQR